MNTRALKKVLPIVAIALCAVALMVAVPETALATDAASTVKSGLSSAGNVAYGSTAATPIENIVGTIVQAVIASLGVIFLILVLYGGILYMTASGDEAKVKKAKALLANAIVGLIITLAAYSIASFVIDQLGSAASTAPAPAPAP